MILFQDIIFGPLKSRRFGTSLGINLLPLENKVCNFDCIYCECGWTNLKTAKKYFFPMDVVLEEMEKKLAEHKAHNRDIESITFAGNGEPTMHPDFNRIVRGTLSLRNKYYPRAKVTVLSNSALLTNKKVVEGLKLADLRVMKLDAGNEELFADINKPQSKITLAKIVKQLKQFEGDLYIQTLFLKAKHRGKVIDNSGPKAVAEWIELLKQINPAHVMIYTIDRETPLPTAQKIEAARLNEIKAAVLKAGLSADVYG